MTNPRPAKGSSSEVLQTLAWLRRCGFKPVPLNPNSKEVVPQCSNYTKPSFRPPTDDEWKLANWGVGVVTGPINSGPVDVDLDCAEAIFFAPRFFPPTKATFGRQSKPRSHMLFRVNAESFDKFAYADPKTKQTMLELRGDQHQTVMPGSVNPSGEMVNWSDVSFPEVPTESPDVLLRAARKTALAVVISRYCWSDGFRNEPTKLLSGIFFYYGWTLDESIDFIKALMDFSGDDDKSRVPTVKKTFQRGDAGKPVAGSGSLRKQLKDDAVVDFILKLMGSESISTMMEYNERWAIVSLGNKFRVVDTSLTPYRFYGRDDFLALREFDTYTNEDGKRVPKSRVWLSSPSRRSYDRVAFSPGNNDDSILNLWPGFAVQPDANACCDAWLKLTREVICGNDQEYDWVMNWLAAIVREPARPARTALVVIGVQGAGKSLWLQYFGKILGPSYIVVTDDKHVHGSFNAHMSTALLLHSEEALFAGDQRHRGIIKSLITDAKRMVEHKGVDAYQVDNYVRLVLLSNEPRAAPAEQDDRRFTVIDMKTDRRKTSPELTLAVVNEMEKDGPAALFHHLLHAWAYDPGVVSINLKNEALRVVKEMNFDPLVQWWSDRLHDGQPLPDNLMWSTQSNSEYESWPDLVGMGTLYASMVNSMRARGARQIPGATEFGMKLRNFMPGLPYYKTRRRFNKPMDDELPPYARELMEVQNAIKLPPLDDCRKAFETHVGSIIDWPGDLPDDDKAAWEKKQSEKPKY